MSSYTEEELKGLTRVELRRAAVAVLGLDNKECSYLKSQDIINRIVSEQGGGGKTSTKTKARPATTGRGRAASQEDKKAEEAPPAARDSKKADPAHGATIERLDVLGATVDENHTELKEMLQQVLDNQAETGRQNFQIFGLLTDLYRFTGEPDELEERLHELDQEWDNQGNESSGD